MNAYDYLMKEGLKKNKAEWKAEGRAEGKAEGKAETVSLKNKEFTIALINSTDFDDAKIATLVGVSIQYVADLRASLKK